MSKKARTTDLLSFKRKKRLGVAENILQLSHLNVKKISLNDIQQRIFLAAVFDSHGISYSAFKMSATIRYEVTSSRKDIIARFSAEGRYS